MIQWLKNPKLIAVLVGVLLLLGVGAYFLTLPKWQRPVQADLFIEGETFHIGDEILITLSVFTEPDNKVVMPELTMPEGVEVLEKEVGTIKKSWKTHQYIDQYRVTTYEPGEYQIPMVSLSYTTPSGEHHAINIPERTLVVQSLLTEEATDIRDVKPLKKAPTNPLVYYLLAGVVLIAAAVYFLIRRLKRKEVANIEAIIPPLPPHEIAYRRLRELYLSDLIETGQIERYFTVLSQIVREYIENRFTVKAQEMTTEEFLERALRKLELSSEHQQLLEDFMVKSDLVKYARFVPHYDQINEAYQAAKRFVDETKDVEIREEGGQVHAELSV